MRTMIERNGVKFERFEFSFNKQGFRIIASPSINCDVDPEVEIWVAETGTKYNAQWKYRIGYWRRLERGPKRESVVKQARLIIKQ